MQNTSDRSVPRDIGEYLAPHRIALWYDHRGNMLEDEGRLWALLRELSAGLAWDALDVSQIPVLSIHFGSIVNHQFTIREVNEDMVWCVMVGAPDPETHAIVVDLLKASKIPGVLRIDPNPPSPRHSFYCLMLYGLLAYDTLIRMDSVSEPGLNRYDSFQGLEVVYSKDETELLFLTYPMESASLPTLVRVVLRNLRRWIREPRNKEALDVRGIIRYAMELRHIGAVRAAGVAAGTALELVLARWSGIEAEKLRAEKTMLGRLITKTQKQLGFPDEAIELLKSFSAVRARCAHALVEGELNDEELIDEVDGFLSWLSGAGSSATPRF
jgi:hypothetical protein